MSTRRLIHEGHEFIGKTRHGASDANSTNVRTTANPGHPSAFGNVAIHDRPPASKFHDALGRAVHLGEVALFVIAGAITTIMHRLPEEPRWTKLIIQRNHRCQ